MVTEQRDLERFDLPLVPDGTPAADLQKLTQSVLAYGDRAVNWYTSRRKWKKKWGVLLLYSAIVFVATSGLIPVIAAMCKAEAVHGLWASLSLGLAGLFLALDRFGGHTRGWIRYVQATQRIMEVQTTFLFQWRTARSNWTQNEPTPAQVADWYDKCKSAVESVSAVVREETNAWADDFRSAVQRFEAELEHARVERRAAEAPGLNKLPAHGQDSVAEPPGK